MLRVITVTLSAGFFAAAAEPGASAASATAPTMILRTLIEVLCGWLRRLSWREPRGVAGGRPDRLTAATLHKGKPTAMVGLFGPPTLGPPHRHLPPLGAPSRNHSRGGGRGLRDRRRQLRRRDPRDRGSLQPRQRA